MTTAAGARRSTTSSLAKRHASASEKVTSSEVAVNKRPALVNITNQRNGSGSHTSALKSSKIAQCSTKFLSTKKGSSTSTSASPRPTPEQSSFEKHSKVAAAPTRATTSSSENDAGLTKMIDASLACSIGDNSGSNSVSMDESMSTCDSFKSSDVEYIDNNEMEALDSIERKTSNMLCISDTKEIEGTRCKRDAFTSVESKDIIVDVDEKLDDPQLCATNSCDFYKHLRASEAKKRPATNFMEKVQKDINASMRAILINWLVEVAEEYNLVPDTLYLTVNYIDRYLSGNVMDKQRLQLLGVACMLIASKYEEICAPQVEEFCYITDNTYFKEEVLEMEASVLNYMKFEMTAPTTKSFLRRFIRAAQGVCEVPLLQLELECLANYIAELSLLEYNMLRFAPSLIAASSIFLAKFILVPNERPWNCTLQQYTLYKAYDLHDCVLALHGLCCSSISSRLPAIMEKYSQHEHEFVAEKLCPPSIKAEYFYNERS